MQILVLVSQKFTKSNIIIIYDPVVLDMDIYLLLILFIFIYFLNHGWCTGALH
jgi:hypothetical protein